MSLLHFVLLFVQALVLSLVFTPLARRFALRIDHMDHPGDRKVHLNSKPVLGGAAIFLAFHVAVLGDWFLLQRLVESPANAPEWISEQAYRLWAYAAGANSVAHKLLGWLAGGILVFVVGLWDDRRGMHPLVKLLAQIVAAAILFWVGIRITFFVYNPLFSFLLTVGWVVAITNSFNLLDNMDGLSGGVAVIALLLFAVSSHTGGQDFLTASLVVLAGSIGGFLYYNFYPSSIFMGDAGSMFIGYNLAALTAMLTFFDGGLSVSIWAVITPLVILAVPIFDTISVIVIRIRNGKPIYVGDTNHFSHRLVAMGMSHRRAVLVIYLVTLCTGLPALILPQLTSTRDVLVVLLHTVAIFFIISILEHIQNNGGPKSHDDENAPTPPPSS